MFSAIKWFKPCNNVSEESPKIVTRYFLSTDPRELRVSAGKGLLERVSNQILVARKKLNIDQECEVILFVFPHQWYDLKEKLDLATMRLGDQAALYWFQHNCYISMTEDRELTEKMKVNDTDEFTGKD